MSHAALQAHQAAYARLGGTAADPALRLTGWRISGDEIALGYRLDGVGEVVERLRLPGLDVAAAAERDPAIAGAITLVHLAAATSYYKAALPPRIVIPPVGPAAEAMLRALLTEGLGELAAQHGLGDLADHVAIETDPSLAPAGADEAAPPSPGVGAQRPSSGRAAADPADAPTVLVPIGGGKDSALTAATAVEAGWDAAGLAVNPQPSMRRTAEAVGVELLTVERAIDRTLLDWNAAGAINGHVPITAIIASIAVLVAALTGREHALLSNEASADEPTRRIDGWAVNHQYSKSSAFERLHVAAADELTGGAARAWSLLRPLPELLVAGAFAAHGDADLLPSVNSCNRAYSLTGERLEWCGRCPKCRFVELMLAPFTSPARFAAATGFDALDDPTQVADFADLLDPERKPYECVGTVDEVRLALDLLADDPRWRDHAAVARLGRAGADADRRLVAMIDAVDLAALPSWAAPPLADRLASLRAERA